MLEIFDGVLLFLNFELNDLYWGKVARALTHGSRESLVSQKLITFRESETQRIFISKYLVQPLYIKNILLSSYLRYEFEASYLTA